MKAYYDHEVISSFTLWLDNYILSQGEAYTVETGVFYKVDDNKVPSSLSVYSAPAGQFVGDSSVAGVFIPSGVVADGVPLSREASATGMKIDFQNGRILVGGDYDVVTGQYTKKDFNVYMASQQEAKVFLDSAYNNDPIFENITGSKRGRYIAPCALVSPRETRNEPFAIGGTDKTMIPISVAIVSDSEFSTYGIRGILRDSSEKCISRVDMGDVPYDYYGDLKSDYYNYDNIVSGLGNERNIFIDDVRTFPIQNEDNQNKDLMITLIEFNLFDVRNS